MVIHRDKNPAETIRQWIKEHSEILRDPWADPASCALENQTIAPDDVGRILDPTFDREEEEEGVWEGKYDKEYNLEGLGTLRLYNGDTFRGYYTEGLRNGWGMVTSPDLGICSITGTWADGHLNGKIRMVTEDTSVYEGWSTRSKLNGPVRKIVMKKFRTFRQQVAWMGRYKDGVPYGQSWAWMEGGGYLTGEADKEGKLTGPNIAFVYPDLCTALVGQFVDGVMLKASPALITDVQILNDIPVPTFKSEHVVRVGSAEVQYKRSTSSDVGENPLIPDPYESRTCKVEKSLVEGGGEGLYARRNIEEGEVVAFYNGVRLPYKPGEKEEWDNSGYKIFVNADYKSGERIDLPGDLIYLENYRATLGHKMNHSFVPNCTEWFFDHPRHGIIPCTVATRPIKAGEEFFLHYGYDPLNCPRWYRLVLDEYLEEHPDLDQWQASDPERTEKKKIVWYSDNLKSRDFSSPLPE